MRANRREYQRTFQKRWANNRRLRWIQANGPCRACGSDYRLEVDHIDPAEKVSHRIWFWSDERRAAELAKCQVLCRRCHSKKTGAENGRRLRGQPGTPKKLSAEEALAIHESVQGGASLRSIGRTFGVWHTTVMDIRDGILWGWLTRPKPGAQLEMF